MMPGVVSVMVAQTVSDPGRAGRGLHVEGGVDGLRAGGGGSVEQAGGVGQFVEEGRVVGDGARVRGEGLEFGVEGGVLVVAVGELLVDPVA